MLTKLRKRLRLTPSTMIASLALVFAMTGGAYAAGKYVITSTKQISPKVLKSLQGKAGAKGATGAAGAAGPAGAAGVGTPGAAGKEGLPGKEGVAGKEGAPGKEGATGKEGSPWTAGGTLPSKKTETGSWSLQTHGEARGITSISFTLPLAGALDSKHVFFIEPEGEEPINCPGTAENPEAVAGVLCVYSGAPFTGELGEPAVKDPSKTFFAGAGAGTTGALIFLNPPQKEPELPASEAGTAYGTWAVTAP